MDTMRHTAITLAVAALLVSAVVALGHVAVPPAVDHAKSAGRSADVRPFRISGSVDNLYPGASEQLRLRLRNRQPFKIIVRRIRVRVSGTPSGCSATYLTVPRFKGRIRIRAKRKKHFSLPVAMSAAAPDSCRSANFPLTYRGRAVRP